MAYDFLYCSAVQMWKADNEGNFQCVAQVQGDLSQTAAPVLE
jgi:hypothetical protein